MQGKGKEYELLNELMKKLNENIKNLLCLGEVYEIKPKVIECLRKENNKIEINGEIDWIIDER